MGLTTVTFVGAELTRHGTAMRGLAAGLQAGEVDAFHDARVASRRLRSVIAGYCDSTHLAAELRHYAAVLGRVRDLDIVAARVEEAELASGLDRAPVLAAIASHRTGRVAASVTYLGSRRYNSLLALATATAAEPPIATGLDAMAAVSAEHAVTIACRRLDQAERRAIRTNLSTDRHRTRKAAKRVRYLAEGAARASEDGAADRYREMATDAEVIQDRLGVVTDAAVALDLLSVLAAEPGTTAEQAEVLHWLTALERGLVEGPL